MLSFIASASLLATTFTSIVSAVPINGPSVKRNLPAGGSKQLAVYFGQGSGQSRLTSYCNNPDIDIMPIGFVTGFPDGVDSLGASNNGWISTNFGNQCGGNYPGTNIFQQCSYFVTDVATCQQQHGTKILISIGGGAGSYKFSSQSEALLAAQQVWEAFGPVPDNYSGPRPFGSNVVDGFDLDLEMNGSAFVADFAQALRNYMDTAMATNPSKQYILTAAPQCVTPDAQLSDALSKVAFDKLFIQFYNTEHCSARAALDHTYGSSEVGGASTDISFDTWASASLKGNPELFIGLPGAASGASNDAAFWLDKNDLTTLLQRFYSNSRFGGVMLWDAMYAANNDNYAGVVKDVFNHCQGSGSTTTTTTTTTAARSTTTTTTSSWTRGTTSSSSSSTTSSRPAVTSSTSSTTWTHTTSASSGSTTSWTPAATSSTSSTTWTHTTSASSSSTTSWTPAATSSTSSATTSWTHTTSSSASSSSSASPTSTTTNAATSSSTWTTRPHSTWSTSSSTTASNTVTTSSSTISWPAATTSATTSSQTLSTTSEWGTTTTSTSASATSSSTTTTPSWTRPFESSTSSQAPAASTTTSTLSYGWGAWASTSSSARTVEPTTKSTSSEQSWGLWSSTTTSKPVEPTSSVSWGSWPTTPADVYVTSTTTVYTDVCPTGFTTVTATITATITLTDYIKPTPNAPWPTGPAGVPTGFYATTTVCSTGCASTPVTVTVTIPVPSGAVTKTVVPTPAAPAAATGKPSSASGSAGSTPVEAASGKPFGTGNAYATGAPASGSGNQNLNGVKAFTGGAAAEQAPATAFSVAVCLVIAVAGLIL